MADYFRIDEIHIDKAWGLHDFDLKLDRPIVYMHGLNGSGRTRACQCIKGMVVMFVCCDRTWVPDFLKAHVTPESEMSMVIGCTEYDMHDVDDIWDKEKEEWVIIEDRGMKHVHGFEIKQPRLKVSFGFKDCGERSEYDNGMRVQIMYERESEVGKGDWSPVSYDEDVHDMRYWCCEQTIFTPDDCIHMMRGLPRKMYECMFDVDPEDKELSGNLARFMPWWALLGDGAENTFAVMDDWFDGLHEELVMHYLKQLAKRSAMWPSDGSLMPRTTIISTHREYRDVVNHFSTPFDIYGTAYYYIKDGTAIRCDKDRDGGYELGVRIKNNGEYIEEDDE